MRTAATSGGERRKIEIARATDSFFLMLDEPFSGIDPISIFDITETLVKLKKQGIGIIITDHNVKDTLNVIDRGYIIAGGKIIISGTPEEIISNEKAKKNIPWKPI